jgi:hypothetical protein
MKAVHLYGSRDNDIVVIAWMPVGSMTGDNRQSTPAWKVLSNASPIQ